MGKITWKYKELTFDNQTKSNEKKCFSAQPLLIEGKPSPSIFQMINALNVEVILCYILKVYTLSTRYQLRITKNTVKITFQVAFENQKNTI